MKKIVMTNSKLITTLLLISFAIIFFHSQFGKTSEESEELHAQHDFGNLVSKTLQPIQDNLLEFNDGAIILTITEDFHVQESSSYWIELSAPLYPRDTSLILLLSTLLI